MKLTLLIIASIYFVSCTTIVSRDLPIVSPKVSRNFRPTLLVSSPRTEHILKADLLRLYFKNLGQFSEVEVTGDYEYVSLEKSSKYDLHIEFDFVSSGFYHPYCILTLAIIPCTPPLHWTLGVLVTKSNEKVAKSYLIKENALQVTWALGPLFSGFGRQENKIKNLKENMLNNFMVKMLEDGIGTL